MVDHKHDESDEAEQGFNDSELEDIMSEIEALENEFSSDLDNEVGGEVVNLSPPESHKPSKASVSSRPEVKKHTSTEPSPLAMEFKVAGEMDMNLKFWIGGEWVHVRASAKDGLTVEVDGGAKFCLPLKRAS
jgi:hypothetical protein